MKQCTLRLVTNLNKNICILKINKDKHVLIFFTLTKAREEPDPVSCRFVSPDVVRYE